MSDAADRLARTRLALIEFVHRKEIRKDKKVQAGLGEHKEGEQWEAAEKAAAHSHGGWFTRVKTAAKVYWRHHPARMGLQVAEPLVSNYARRSPATFLGIAALAGAVFMVARPWRLISVTGLLIALAKSPQLAAVVMSAMSGADMEDEPPH
jgi:hypothetical protein